MNLLLLLLLLILNEAVPAAPVSTAHVHDKTVDVYVCVPNLQEANQGRLGYEAKRGDVRVRIRPVTCEVL